MNLPKEELTRCEILFKYEINIEAIFTPQLCDFSAVNCGKLTRTRYKMRTTDYVLKSGLNICRFKRPTLHTPNLFRSTETMKFDC